jgi:glycosyltransferase involved in cell wall biosynthesis
MIIYLGNYVSNTIKKQRALPTHNSSCNNRMIRLSMAIKSAGEKIVILSPGVSMRLGSQKKLIHGIKIEVKNKIPIIYCSALGYSFISILWECFSEPYTLFKLHKRNRIRGLLVYCFYPPHIVTTVLARFILRVPVVLDLEDISIPRLADWKNNNEVRPMQQLVAWPSMKILISLAQGVIVPTQKFLSVFSGNKRSVVITGCLKVNSLEKKYPITNKIHVLFSGKIENEHGIDLLVNALHVLEKNINSHDKFVVDICGSGNKEKWLISKLKLFSYISINVHGFVSEQRYADLLYKSNVCLALQNPDGRFSRYKTPSKAYEFIGSGKTTIVSDVGDFSKLPKNVIILLKPYTSENLGKILLSLDNNRINDISKSAHAYAYQNLNLKYNGKKILKLFQ